MAAAMAWQCQAAIVAAPRFAGAPRVGGVSLDGGSLPVALSSRHVLRGSFAGFAAVPDVMRRLRAAAGTQGVGIWLAPSQPASQPANQQAPRRLWEA